MAAVRRRILDRPPWRRLKLVSTFTRELVDVWRTHGLGLALSEIRDVLLVPFHRHLDRRFDRRHGLETEGIAPLSRFSILDGGFDYQRDKRRYEAVPLVTFARLMKRLPSDLSPYVFIDFGSGKGRALLLASQYGFKRIAGVEFATELHEIAQRNLDTYSRRAGCRAPIELINQDATSYSIPDEKCVFYLYNPFGGAVLAEVISNIEKSYYKQPRKMFFLYVNPRASHVLEGKQFVRLVEKRRFGKKWAIYETADPA